MFLFRFYDYTFYNVVELLTLATSSFGEKVANFFEQINRRVS